MSLTPIYISKTETTESVKQVVDHNQAELDLKVNIEDMPTLELTDGEQYEVMTYIGRMSGKIHHGLFDVFNHSYMSKSVIMHITTTQSTKDAHVSSVSDIVRNLTRNRYSFKSGLPRALEKLCPENLPARGSTEYSEWAPTVVLDDSDKENLVLTLHGQVSKVVVYVRIRSQISGITNGLLGYDSYGELFGHLLIGIGFKLNEQNELVYTKEEDGEVVYRKTFPKVGLNEIFTHVGFTRHTNLGSPEDLKKALVNYELFNLSCAKLSYTLESTEPNPSPVLLEFQNEVRALHLTKNFPAVCEKPSFVKDASRTFAFNYTTRFEEVEALAVKVHNMKRVVEKKLEDLADLVGMTTEELDSVIAVKFRPASSVLAYATFNEVALTSNVFTLAKKLGLERRNTQGKRGAKEKVGVLELA